MHNLICLWLLSNKNNSSRYPRASPIGVNLRDKKEWSSGHFFYCNVPIAIYMLSVGRRIITMDPQKKAEQLRGKLLKLGPILPGSISEQWNICGTPGCKCKDPANPKKHGPYYQLSFSVGGRSSSLFIRKEDIFDARQRVRRYREFKRLITELVQANVDLIRKNGFGRTRS
jgi:hypothetical protein